MKELEISLTELLDSRDRRWSHEKELMAHYPKLTLICLTVVMPGKVKRNANSLVVAKAATKAIHESFDDDMRLWEEKDLPTGFEAYSMVKLSPEDVKRRCCEIEETHPLGRLFDVDVIGPGGVPISRKQLGLEPRKCLICGNEARLCMRMHTHTQEELHAKIKEMISDYVQRL
ncbi:MAG: citrate lyase holo-[acyl-carrier protein] synthase [Prevotella sp.]|jgi:holo-ACP synthase CitX